MSALPTPANEPSDYFELSNMDAHQEHRTQERPKKWVPMILRLPSTIALCTIFMLLAISLEASLHESVRLDGFRIPSLTSIHVNSNDLSQFLKSFIPNIIFVPIVQFTRQAYQELKLLQPYIALARGRSPPHKSITVEYESQSPHEVVISSFTRRHWALAAASVVILWSTVFTSLAGALFVIRLSDVSSQVPVALVGTLGVNDASIASPATFVAAAGKVDPGAFSNNVLPPFVFRDTGNATQGWMIPPFTVGTGVSTRSDGAASVSLDTQVLNIEVECIPASTSITTSGSNFNFTTSLSDSCRENFKGTLVPGYYAWIGVFADADASCIPLINSGAPPNTTVTEGTLPIAIGFTANGTIASAAFCYGYQKVFNATVTFDLRIGRAVPTLTNLTYVPGHELEQYVLNGVDSFSGTGFALGDAVISHAGKADPSSMGIDANRQNMLLSTSNVILAELVRNDFLGYLLVAANNLFVVSSTSVTEGHLVIQQLRLHTYAPVIHTLSALCALSGFILVFVFILHGLEQRSLHLVDRPGTIGVIGAMLSAHSSSAGAFAPFSRRPLSSSTTSSFRQTPAAETSFLHLLDANDTNKGVQKKLKGKEFRLNPVTGAIEIDDGIGSINLPSFPDAEHGDIGWTSTPERLAFLDYQQTP